MYKVVMVLTVGEKRKTIDMPTDKHLDLMEACNRADLYAKRNTSATFMVVNNENGDVDYETRR